MRVARGGGGSTKEGKQDGRLTPSGGSVEEHNRKQGQVNVVNVIEKLVIPPPYPVLCKNAHAYKSEPRYDRCEF